VTSAFDQRIVRLGIELENGVNMFEGLYISAKGVLVASAQLNECEVVIYNLTAAQRNYLLTQTSPFAQPRTAKLMTLDVGRESYGTFRLFQGNVIASAPTQPPDIGVVLRALTGAFALGNILPQNQPQVSKLSTIAKSVADANNCSLNFYATDKNINNFSYSGATQNQVDKLTQCGGVNAFINNGSLTVTDQNQSVPGGPFPINAGTGMVGIPEADESGVNVRVMIDPAIKLGASVTIESKLNQAVNGTYSKIYRMSFEVANRETPFWYDLYVTNNVLQ
jgi:hypothetical protein